MLAACGYNLKLYNFDKELQESGTMKKKNNAPNTSLDWSSLDPNLIVTSSVDTTCSVWDITTMRTRTQLIAHDKEVFDVAFSPQSPHIFVSVGSDGSLRMFDLRSLEHSTIMYENSESNSLLAVEWNPLDPFFISCIADQTSSAIVLDTRISSVPVAVLQTEAQPNQICWSTANSAHLMTGDRNGMAMIWELNNSTDTPILCYRFPGSVDRMSWKGNSLAASIDKSVHIINI